MRSVVLIFLWPLFGFSQSTDSSWIRINQLGYTPGGVKVAVWCSKNESTASVWELVESKTGQTVYRDTVFRWYGSYGPFIQTARLDFSKYAKQGRYYLRLGNALSPEFTIGPNVYSGAADFCLRYMRQQRTGFNPFLKDSCHTRDGYALYGAAAGLPDSTHVDVVGGWHDASDYLQYSTTSANATYHLLMAYRDFPKVFTDRHLANGLEGANKTPDVLDEARWGLEWLSKMHPRPDWLFNQIADDRDHISMRMPGQDSQYHRGYERPVYFVTGEPQQRGKFMNKTTGTSSVAAKFSSAFTLGYEMFRHRDRSWSQSLRNKAISAYAYSKKKQGFTQTVSVLSPYIYAEENWTDDMELATVKMAVLGKYEENSNLNSHSQLKNENVISKELSLLTTAFQFAKAERVTPWMQKDTASHYQWYPFINVGHYELAKQLTDDRRDSVLSFYRAGIEAVWSRAKQNAFFRGVPFIWCSNNLTTSFAIQCRWYRELSTDIQYAQLEQANIDWLFGCNPWGTSMVYGLPAGGDTPEDPHAAFTHFKKGPIDGGLVDGPVSGTIFSGLIGIKLYRPDGYAPYQSKLAVYHDDYGDYSTNEPTMDGTASLIYLLAGLEARPLSYKK